MHGHGRRFYWLWLLTQAPKDGCVDQGRVSGVGKCSVSKPIELDSQQLRCCLQADLILCIKCTLKEFRQINGTSEGTDQPNRTARPGQYRQIFSPCTAGFSLRVKSLRQSAKHFRERSCATDVFVSDAS